MHDDSNEISTDVAVLIRVDDLHSEEPPTFDFFVDPGRLFDSRDLTLEEIWMVRGTLQENVSAPTKKRRKLNKLSISSTGCCRIS
jgi:hypothetical protein